MNIIFKIILINIIIIFTLKYSIYLAIFLFILLSLWLLKLYYNIDNLLEGYENFEYQSNFWNMLNKDIKVNREYDILYNIVIDKFTKLLKRMDKTEHVPPNQMCIGELGEWGTCSKKCGRGKKVRRFNELQKAGKTGIQCIYENGQIESKECFNKLCAFGGKCEDDLDCISTYCDPKDKKCSYHNICSRAKLNNCNFEQCEELNKQYGEYTYDLNSHRCENVALDLVMEQIKINEDNPDPLGEEGRRNLLSEQLSNKFTSKERELLCLYMDLGVRDADGNNEKKVADLAHGNLCGDIKGDAPFKMYEYENCEQYYWDEGNGDQQTFYPCIWKADISKCEINKNRDYNAYCEKKDLGCAAALEVELRANTETIKDLCGGGEARTVKSIQENCNNDYKIFCKKRLKLPER